MSIKMILAPKCDVCGDRPLVPAAIAAIMPIYAVIEFEDETHMNVCANCLCKEGENYRTRKDF